MSNVTTKRSENIIAWDISDHDHGSYTTAILQVHKNGGFCVSFTNEYAGLDHTWNSPGDSIPDFLCRLNFDYVMVKLTGSYSEAHDIEAENDVYIKWLKKNFEGTSVGDNMLSAVTEFNENNPTLRVCDWVMHCFEHDNQPIAAICEEYEDVEKDAPTERIVKWKYKHFWDVIWPRFIQSVRSHYEDDQPKRQNRC